LGLAVKVRKHEKLKGYAGTPGYTAPEVIRQKYYDHRADYFSLGVLIYRMICGKKPFTTPRGMKPKSPHNSADSAVLNLKPTFNENYFDKKAADFLSGLLEKSPDKRLGSRHVNDLKSHPFFEEVNFGFVEVGYMKPAFVPKGNAVHADTLHHISQLHVKHEEKIQPEFKYEKLLKNFSFHSTTTWEREIVTQLQKLPAEKFSLILSGENLVKMTQDECCVIL